MNNNNCKKRIAKRILRILRCVGIMHTYDIMRTRLVKHKVAILAYHRIDWTTHYPWSVAAISPEVFEKEINNLQKNIQHRNATLLKYSEIFKTFGLKNTSNAPLRFVLEVENRDEWIERLSPVLRVETWFDSCAQGKRDNLWEIGYNDGACPVAEEVERRIINFPTHLKVRPKDIDNIARRLDEGMLSGITNEVR